MNRLLGLIVLSIWGLSAQAQGAETRYCVQVGAFEQPVSADYFKKLERVYETVDINQIYRYYIDAPDLGTAQLIEEQAKAKGFVYCRVVDKVAIREQCELQCGYTPPQRTAKRMGTENKPSSSPSQSSSESSQTRFAQKQAETKQPASSTTTANPQPRQTKSAPKTNTAQPQPQTGQTVQNKPTETQARSGQTPQGQAGQTAQNAKPNKPAATPSQGEPAPAKVSRTSDYKPLPKDIHSNAKYSDNKGRGQ